HAHAGWPLVLEPVEGEHAGDGEQQRQGVLHDVACRGGLVGQRLARQKRRLCGSARRGACRGWHARRDSNPQPAVLETAALPIELLAYGKNWLFPEKATAACAACPCPDALGGLSGPDPRLRGDD